MLPASWQPLMAQEDWMIGLTSAAKALLLTVLQSTDVLPPPPSLLQEMLMETNKIIADTRDNTLTIEKNFWGRMKSSSER